MATRAPTPLLADVLPDHLHDRPQRVDDLERQHDLGRVRGADRLERVEVLQPDRLAVEAARDLRELASSASARPSAASIAACRSPSARRIADCFSPSATRIAASRLPSDSVTVARRFRSAESWRFIASWTFSRRQDVADLDGRDLDAPALGDLVELLAQQVVDLVAVRQHVVEGRSPITARSVVVAIPCAAPAKFDDLDDRDGRVEHPPVDQEVDRDRRVVLGDALLVRDRQELLAQVDPDRALDDRGSA